MSKEKIAIFIDTENLVPWVSLEEGPENLLKEISLVGQPIVRKAYGKWTTQSLAPHQGALSRLGFELIHTYHPVSGKNSVDIQMTVDIMEYAWRVKEIKWFVLATGDSDFSALFRRLRELGKEIIGVGPRSKLSENVKSSCSRYIYTDSRNEKNLETKASELDDIIDLVEGILRKIGEPITCPHLKSRLINIDSAFDERSLGYSSFNKFIEDIPDVTLSNNDGTWYVQLSEEETNKYLVSKNGISDDIRSSKLDTYTRILKKKGWKILPKNMILEISKIMKNLAPLTKNEIVDTIIDRINGEIDSPMVRKVINLFFKGGLIEVSASNEKLEGQNDWQLKKVKSTEILKTLDYALIDRLVRGCKELDLEIEVKYVSLLLMGSYQANNIQSNIDNVIKSLKKEENLK